MVRERFSNFPTPVGKLDEFAFRRLKRRVTGCQGGMRVKSADGAPGVFIKLEKSALGTLNNIGHLFARSSPPQTRRCFPEILETGSQSEAGFPDARLTRFYRISRTESNDASGEPEARERSND